MTKLTINQLHKAYGENVVIPNIDLTINEGEFVVFVGPSGCGKSTLLRTIAGLESVTKGDIHLNGRCLNGVHPSEREVAMVFQSYALYPHMSVRKNIAFPLKMSGVDKHEAKKRVDETADKLQLTPYLERLPGALSGGQRQRVAIGRAIVRNPELFLFDEPLSNLDAKLRGEMRVYLKQLHQQLNATMIYVTHDQVEAMTLADKIVVLNKGNIEQIGAPETLYNSPANKFVAAFIGSPVMNFIGSQTWQTLFPHGKLPESIHTIGIRPNQVIIDRHSPDATMHIEVIEPLGHARLYYGKLGGKPFVIESSELYAQGSDLPINLNSTIKHTFDVNDQRIDIAILENAA